ncbi:uncharacterized protein LOC113562648 [Ooceraea biroi]|uniref:uncharacterized protein LOC113562648 n=1 Tax=Ooceraea biroi TaxID=2015173 RepID=UPI000F07D3A0|nr:uncharacterized protein LOC113562648 [Ooceraea biroi]
MSQDRDSQPSEAGNFSALKKKRATIKGSCTRIQTFMNNISQITSDVIAHIEERRERLDAYWCDYDNVQTEIETLDDKEVEDRIAFEDAFYLLRAQMRRLLANTSGRYTSSSVSHTTASQSESKVDSSASVRLPKISLPSFSGKYEEWLPFHDMFIAIVHDNKALNNIQRFQYLRASLSGDAASLIAALEISDSNYAVAWDILRQRYDNKRVIIQTHIRGIMDLPAMVKENSKELRQISDGACRHILALKALKRPVDYWDDLLVYILSSKLDSVTAKEWQSSLKNGEIPTFKQFTEFVSHTRSSFGNNH